MIGSLTDGIKISAIGDGVVDLEFICRKAGCNSYNLMDDYYKKRFSKSPPEPENLTDFILIAVDHILEYHPEEMPKEALKALASKE